MSDKHPKQAKNKLKGKSKVQVFKTKKKQGTPESVFIEKLQEKYDTVSACTLYFFTYYDF